MNHNGMNFDWDSREQFLDHLSNLIGDLRESGSTATAEDFEDAHSFIRELEMGITTVLDRLGSRPMCDEELADHCRLLLEKKDNPKED